MFSQVQFADWSVVVTVLAFAVSFTVFASFVVGAIRSPRDKVRHLAELPLEKEKRS
jgi:hypothetical protein